MGVLSSDKVVCFVLLSGLFAYAYANDMQMSYFSTMAITNEYFISIVLDKRRQKANGKFPVKLRVFTRSPRKQKMFPTVMDMTESEFHSTWVSVKTKPQHRDNRLKLQAIEQKANKIAEQLSPFTIDEFEKRLYRSGADADNLQYQFDAAIDRFNERGQVSTAELYMLSLRCIQRYLEESGGEDISSISLREIDYKWLERFEDFMKITEGKSFTTISMYMRSLRAIFNSAIASDDIPEEFYPFGKKKYTIPSLQVVKEALNHEQLARLFHSEPRSSQEEKAKDFWFFSYACHGMNMKDILLLRNRDINDGKIHFLRAKTIRTSKERLKHVTVILTDFTLGVISKYKNESNHPDQYVFPTLVGVHNPVEQKRRIKNFTRFVNQHLQHLATVNDLPTNISTMWARHSFATNAIRNGASMEYVSRAMSHSNLRTTQGYFAGFEDSTHREIQAKLMQF